MAKNKFLKNILKKFTHIIKKWERDKKCIFIEQNTNQHAKTQKVPHMPLLGFSQATLKKVQKKKGRKKI